MSNNKEVMKNVKKLSDWELERQRKLDEKRLQKMDPTEEECSFKPIVNHKDGDRRRTHEEFLAD